jgi:general secretion pathway protein G
MSSVRTSSRPRPDSSGGFTLLELIIVVAIIGILATIVLPQLKDKPLRAKEAVLKSNLVRVRDALDQYYADKGRYPSSLQDLVEGKYLRKLPIDPITNRDDSWILVQEEVDEEAPLPEGEDGEEAAPGIVDIRSGSKRKSLSGEPYSEW